MRILTSVSLLAMGLYAAQNNKMDEAEFMGFIAKNGKNYTDKQEMDARRENFAKSKKIVQRLNASSRGAFFDLTHFADLHEHEKERLVRYGESFRQAIMDDLTKAEGYLHSHGRMLSGGGSGGSFGPTDEVKSVNWLDAGKVTDVRWQGYQCNASWAISAVTVLEAMQAIKDDTQPIALSDQEAMDCTAAKQDQANSC